MSLKRKLGTVRKPFRTVPYRSLSLPNIIRTLPKIFGKTLSHVPKSFRTIPCTVEKPQNLPIGTTSHDGGKVPNPSEGARNDATGVRNASEGTPSLISEQRRTAPACSAQHEGCTITVREAARIFQDAGVPRTERAITNWCNRNARGIIRLDCCYNEAERKYFIAPNSIDRVVKEERRKMQYIEYRDGGGLSSQAEELSERMRHERTTEEAKGPSEDSTKAMGSDGRSESRSSGMNTDRGREGKASEDILRNGAERESETFSEAERARLKELQMENYEVRVQLEGQKHLVRQFDKLVDGERERHEREKLALVDRLTDARHEIGTLEQKLLQLEAPKGTVRDAETRPPQNTQQTNVSGYRDLDRHSIV
jgi:hypothetical protein